MLEIKSNVTAHIHGGTQVQADDGTLTLNEFLKEEITPVDDGKLYPFHSFDALKVVTTSEEVDDPTDVTCVKGEMPPEPVYPTITGAVSRTLNQGADFDLVEGVVAHDGDGNEIPFTVEPDTIDTCEVGEHTFTYSATADGVTTTHTRIITVEQAAAPTISGLTELTVEVGEEFDPLDGVSAVDSNGNPVVVTYEAEEEPIYELTNITVNANDSLTVGGVTLRPAKRFPITATSTVSDGDRCRIILEGARTDGQLVVEHCEEEKAFSVSYGIGAVALENCGWDTSGNSNYLQLWLEPPNDVPTSCIVHICDENDPQAFPNVLTVDKIIVYRA